MIRAMRQTDVPEVLALLEWMDDLSEREVLSPHARSTADLRLECEGKSCLVDEADDGTVRGWCAVSPGEDGPTLGGLVLEGPLGEGNLAPLVRTAVGTADASVFAFCAHQNSAVCAALEAEGFSAMHTTDFYRLRRSEVRPRRLVPLPGDVRVARRLERDAYLRLYRSGEDVWSDRLSWSWAQFESHFARDDVRLLVLMEGARPLGFAELELGEAARLTYVAVHPAERGRGLGRVLLSEAVREAFGRPEVQELVARAHDHESAAQRLYRVQGFTASRSVTTYLRDPVA